MASAPSHETENLASSTSPITALHPDIIHTHILTRLDGPALAATSSVCSELRQLCNSDDDLWRNVCTATWPSLLHRIASHVISTFPGGHRSFFSDAFPSLHHDNHHRHRSYPPPPELIFAVDIYCQGKPLFSSVQRIETRNKRFLLCPLHVDNLLSKVLVPTPVKFPGPTLTLFVAWILKYMQDNLRLSWIIIDPTRKRAANLSCWKPVSVRWVNIDVLKVVYAVVMTGEKHRSRVKVKCTWDWNNGFRLYVRKVKMVMEDKDGWRVSGSESAECN